MIDLQRIIEDISPTPEERDRYSRISSEVMERVRRSISSLNLNIRSELVGSAARDTNLTHALRNSDLDIFLVFPRDADRKSLVKTGLEIGHKVLPDGIERYAEHPYVTGTVDGVKVDIVPCYEMNRGETKISSVDRTIPHNEYLTSVLDTRTRGDIRLLKAFLIGAGLYGSEVSRGGFSGFVTELLVIRLGGFEGVVRRFSSQKGRVIVGSPEHDTKGFQDPLVVPDPVDPGRNAAAAVSLENLSRFKIAAKLYMRKPSIGYFRTAKRREENWRKLPDRQTTLRLVIIPRPDQVDDVIFPQAQRLRRTLVSKLDRAGFLPLSSGIFVDHNVCVILECERGFIPIVERHVGPPVDSENALEYMDKWVGSEDRLRGPFVDGDRLVVERNRKITRIDDYIAQEIRNSDIGKHLNALKDQARVLNPSDLTEYDYVIDSYMSRGLFDP